MANTTIRNEALTLTQLAEELEESWYLPYAVLVLGPGGVGKSSIYRQVLAKIATGDPDAEFRYNKTAGCEVVGGEVSDGTPEGDLRELKTAYGFIDMRLSQVEPQDLAGIPMPENGVTRRHIPEDMPVVGADHLPEKGLLLLDEVNQSDLAVQKAMFSIVLDRKIGTKMFKPGWRVMAAGNRLEDSSAVSELPGPLQNRFSHYTVTADFKTFKLWALKHNIAPEIITYLETNAMDLCKGSGENGEYAFPTPRTWEQVSNKINYWKNADKQHDKFRQIRALTALIGTATATKFVAHMELAAKINVADYFSGKITREFDSTSVDKAWVLMTALYSHVLNTMAGAADDKKNKQLVTAWNSVIKFVLATPTFKKTPELISCLLHDLIYVDASKFHAALKGLTDEEMNEAFAILKDVLKI